MRLYSLCVIAVITLGSFLFGYETSVISGALKLLGEEFNLTSFAEGFLVSILLLGAAIGIFLGGFVADRYGRRPATFLSTVAVIVGSVVVLICKTKVEFLLGRFITGLGVGIVSSIAPLYLAEIAPTRLRGAFVSSHQLIVTLGILCGYIANYYLTRDHDWRLVFGLALVPALLQALLLYFCAESPSWLFLQKRERQSASSWKRYFGKTFTPQQKNDLLSLQKETSMKTAISSWNPKIKKMVFFGILLNMFQQITGINAVIYFAPRIFELSGYATTDMTLLATIGVGAINFFVTFFAVHFLDKLGRRPLLLTGLAGMCVSLSILSAHLFSHMQTGGLVALLSIFAYVAFFAVGLGPVTAVFVSEAYPLKIRGKAISLTTAFNWIGNYLVTLVFLDLVRKITLGGAFVLFGVLSAVAFVFVYYFLPETKGKSLEEIEKSLL